MNALTAAYIHLQALELAHEVHDFTLCQRKNGSIYGIADGLKCRKGTETSEDIEVSRQMILSSKLFDYLSETEKKKADPFLQKLNDEQFARVTTMAAEIVASPVTPNVRSLRPDQYEDLKANQTKLHEIYSDPKSYIRLLRKVDNAEVDAMMSLLTSEVKNRNGLVVSQVAKNEGVSKDEVKRALIKRFMEQDGKDFYTGKPLSLLNAELEHIVPFTIIGESRSNRLDNLVWIGREINAAKSNLTMSAFVDKYIKNRTLEQTIEKYNESVKKKLRNGSLKEEAKKDVKMLGTQSAKIIKKYGNQIGILTAELGFPTGFKMPMKKDRNVTTPLYVTVKIGNAKINPQHFIISQFPNWTPKQVSEAQGIVRSYWTRLKNGRESMLPEEFKKLKERMNEEMVQNLMLI
jgi:hypothetical protein